MNVKCFKALASKHLKKNVNVMPSSVEQFIIRDREALFYSEKTIAPTLFTFYCL